MPVVTQRSVAREVLPERCAYCGAPLPVNIEGIEAWRVGTRFVCNEFCADGIPEELTRAAHAPSASSAIAPGNGAGPTRQ